jgi:hypothetical protein
MRERLRLKSGKWIERVERETGSQCPGLPGPPTLGPLASQVRGLEG